MAARLPTTNAGLRAAGISGSVKIEGLEIIKRNLRKVRVEVRKKVAVRAVRRAAKVFKSRAEQWAPVDRGDLRSDIKISVRPLRADPSVITAMVGPGKQSFYGRFQEYGTAFIRASPWMRPSFDMGKLPAALEIVKTFRNFFKRKKIR